MWALQKQRTACVRNGEILKMIFLGGGRVTRWKTDGVKSVGTSQWLAVPNSIQIQIILEHFGGLA